MEGKHQYSTISVEVVYGLPEKQALLKVEVPKGCTAGQAIERSGIREVFPDMEVNPDSIGVFGKKVPPEQPLLNGDRVEIYRPLIADPKESRRQRAKK
jgi:putative ubiquitin-RnfH superfamily antitoxin RatB of RatAB toxin-antitoxin module